MEPALDLFLNMLDGPDVGVRRDLIVELSLLLPLELEKKYPILPKLMKPLVMALKVVIECGGVALPTPQGCVADVHVEQRTVPQHECLSYCSGS